jgi:predicted dehydrogenase
MESLNAAIAGVGFVGRAHLEALRRLGIHVAGVLGSTPDKSRSAAQTLGVARGYVDFAELLADASVDVVHVCTPNNLHLAMASAAMRAGKHVICEKPLALTAQESRELVRIQQETGRVCAVCFNLRYYPLCHEARARVLAGQIGQVRMVHGQFLQDWLFSPAVWSWRLDSSVGGALRTVADIGSHWLDLVEWLSGLRVTEVCADHPQTAQACRRRRDFLCGSA